MPHSPQSRDWINAVATGDSLCPCSNRGVVQQQQCNIKANVGPVAVRTVVSRQRHCRRGDGLAARSPPRVTTAVVGLGALPCSSVPTPLTTH